MNFEAVPCVLKNSEGTPMYGLLIRPLQNQQFLINVPSTSSSVATNSQQVPVATTSGQIQQSCSETSIGGVQSQLCPTSSTNSSLLNLSSINGIASSLPLATNSSTSRSRRNYQTILPRGDNNSTSSNSSKNSWNPVFIPATAVQNFQQSRVNSTFSAAASTPISSAMLHNNQQDTLLGREITSSASFVQNQLYNSAHNTPQISRSINNATDCSLSSTYPVDSSQVALQNSSPSLQSHTRQNQQISTPSVYGNFGNNTCSGDNIANKPNSQSLTPAYSSSSMTQNFNNPQSQQYQQNLSTSDLENIFQGMDPNEINNMLQQLSFEGSELVQLDSAALNGNQLEMLETVPPLASVNLDCQQTSNKCSNSYPSTSNTYESINLSTTSSMNCQQTQATSLNVRPPCRYQHMLMDGNNLRVNNGSASFLSASINEDRQFSVDCNVSGNAPSAFDGDSVESELQLYNYRPLHQQHALPPPIGQPQPQSFHILEHRGGGHPESGTPDSGIQSIGESPHAVTQNSPMQHVASSHSPSILNSQMSPRFFSSSYSMYLNSPPSHQQKLSDHHRQRPNSEYSNTVMEPLTVNTGYETISDCESTAPTRAIKCSSNNKVNTEGLLAASSAKLGKKKKSQITTVPNEDYADMPSLERQVPTGPESSKQQFLSPTITGNNCDNQLALLPAIDSETVCNSPPSSPLVLPNESTIVSENVTTNLNMDSEKLDCVGLKSVDANSLVDKILSSLQPDQLSSFSQLFEAKLKAAGININLCSTSVTQPAKEVPTGCQLQIQSSSMNSSQKINFGDYRQNNAGKTPKCDKSLTPNILSCQAVTAEPELNTKCDSLSSVQGKALEKLNDYRLKRKQRMENDNISHLCELADRLFVPSVCRLNQQNFQFNINWAILENNWNNMKTVHQSREQNRISAVVEYNSLQNLEQEASESGNEDDVKSEGRTNSKNVEINKNRQAASGVVLVKEKNIENPLKIKFRLFRCKESASPKCSTEGDVCEPMNILTTDNSIISVEESNEPKDKLSCCGVNLPLKKRFKLRHNDKFVNNAPNASDEAPLAVCRKRHSKSTSLEKTSKSKKIKSDKSIFTNDLPKLTDLTIDLETISIDTNDFCIPTLSPQVATKQQHSLVDQQQQEKMTKSVCSPNRKNNRLNPNWLKRCKTCWTWIKVSNGEKTSAKDKQICSTCSSLSPNSLRFLQLKSERKRRKAKEASSKLSSAQTLTCPPSLETTAGSEINILLDGKTDSTNRNIKTTEPFLLPKKKFEKCGLYTERSCNAGLPVPEMSMSPRDCHLLQSNCLQTTDFRLPYDIWWEQVYQKDYVCKNPSTDFKRIRSNIYVDVKVNPTVHCQTCNCEKPSKESSLGCGENCLNKMMFTECNSNSCRCGDRCSNRRLQKRQWCDGLERFDTKTEKGCGVRTNKRIKRGTFVCEYLGEVVQAETFAERMRTWYKNCHHHYALNLDSGTVIDGYRCGSTARFINHSCDPNCEVQKWMVNGHYRMGVFALRDLKPGEELTYHYNFHAFNSPQSCLCFSDNCSGSMGISGNRSRHNHPATVNHQQRKNKPVHIMFRQNSSDPNSISSQCFKPLTPKERILAKKRRLFLLRNFDRLQKKLKMTSSSGSVVDEDEKRADAILAQLTALKSKSRNICRNNKETEPENHQQHVVPLVEIFQSILNGLLEAKDPNSGRLYSQPFMSFSKTDTFEPNLSENDRSVDLNFVQKKLDSGAYTTLPSFDADVNAVLHNAKFAYSHQCNFESKSVVALERLYESLKIGCIDRLRNTLRLGDAEIKEFTNDRATCESKSGEESCVQTLPPVGSYDPDDDTGVWWPTADSVDPDVDKVRCVCGILDEDGTMVQCDKCLYWLHGDCVSVSGESVSEYICEFCQNGGRKSVRNVVLIPQPETRFENCTYYRSLMCGSLQIRLGDCVYLKRNVDEKHKRLLVDFNRECVRGSTLLEPSADEDSQDNTLLLDHVVADIKLLEHDDRVYDRADLRIMRVERLFIGPRGVRFIFGNYFAHPHETFCEPARRFYKNEVFVTPLYDTWPAETVVGRCLVVDPQTYCKGRPRYPKYDEADVYICEYRVDKGQRLFNKSSVKNLFPTNTKSYIFNEFDEKMKISRNFTPFSSKLKNKQNGVKRKVPQSTVNKETPHIACLQNATKNIIAANEKTFITVSRRKKESRLAKLINKVISRARCE